MRTPERRLVRETRSVERVTYFTLVFVVAALLSNLAWAVLG